MRDPDRIDVFCNELAKIWHKVPQWRFGQLIDNLTKEYHHETHRDIFFVEDDELLEFFKRYFEEA